MDPDTLAAEDGLVRHQSEERPLVLERLDAVVQSNTSTGNQRWVDQGRGDGLWDICGQKGRKEKGTTIEM